MTMKFREATSANLLEDDSDSEPEEYEIFETETNRERMSFL